MVTTFDSMSPLVKNTYVFLFDLRLHVNACAGKCLGDEGSQ